MAHPTGLRTTRLLKRLARDERGAVMVYVAVALTVFMGFAALVIDGGRLYTLDREMQFAADAIALAGAAELDGNADAIIRADKAMGKTEGVTALVQNDQTFGTGAAAITGFSRRFLTALPADSEPLSAADAFVTTDPAVARFVQVNLTDGDSRFIDTMFAPAIGGGPTAPAGAVAIAGYTSAVCKFTPLFMCNPYDTPAEFLNKVGKPEERRRLIALKQSNGASAKYGPGNFGFLTHIGDTKAEKDNFKEQLAKVDPGACFEKSGVDTEPGNKVAARTALNTRFDLYDGNFNKHKNKAEYRPARNVTKGYTGPDCNPSYDETNAMGFPLDSDSLTSSNRMGNGDWGGKFDAYWDMNHKAMSKPSGWTNADPPSRYNVYRWEIDTHIVNNTPKGENGVPQCSKAAVNDDPDRRILYAAIIDCNAYGDLVKGRAEDIPVLSFVKMFMTQPMNKKSECGKSEDEDDAVVEGCNDTLFVEMIDRVEPGIDDELIHDIVQLYR